MARHHQRTGFDASHYCAEEEIESYVARLLGDIYFDEYAWVWRRASRRDRTSEPCWTPPWKKRRVLSARARA
jgi:hypothetical protein